MERVSRIRISDVRAIVSADVELIRDGLTVLIGENGSGKSTIVECLELLRRAAETNFFEHFYRIHGGMPGLLRAGATSLRLEVEVAGRDAEEPDERCALGYVLELERTGSGAVVRREELLNLDDSFRVLTGLPDGYTVWDDVARQRRKGPRNADQLALPLAAPSSRRVERMREALAGLEVHLGFDSLAAWAARSIQRVPTLRGASLLYPASRLSMLGGNLASAWAELRNQASADWERTLDLVRAGIGPQVDTVLVPPDMGGGSVTLALRFRHLPSPIPASQLSDGQLAWLAFVAMVRLASSRTLLVIDEPELHLHPHLVSAVVELLQGLRVGVLVSTHSDRILAELRAPAEQVRVCEIDEQGRATVARLDAEELARWLQDYSDLGAIREAGYLPRLIVRAPA